MKTAAPVANHRLPLVVQLGFVGRRCLLPANVDPRIDEDDFHDLLALELRNWLSRLPQELALMPGDEICAVSSLARGGDLVFTRACKELGWRQRILLPQAREDFLRAGAGPRGEWPDFTEAEAEGVRNLLAASVDTALEKEHAQAKLHIIEERVVSTSGDRDTRFEDVNLELLRTCDVLICLMSAEPGEGKPAGTEATLALAQRLSLPVLELRVAVAADGKPLLTEVRHGFEGGRAACSGLTPTLPEPLNATDCTSCSLEDGPGYRRTLLEFADRTANHRQNVFRWAALAIVGAHVLATGLAIVALKSESKLFLIWLLSAELVFLAAGLSYHWWLHHSHAVRHWAMARLSAQIASSVTALAQVRCTLEYLQELPLPLGLRALLRTLSVLHLQGLLALPEPWHERRDVYVQMRLIDREQGQLGYYEAKLRKARRWLSVARWSFYVSSLGAFSATAAKLAMKFGPWQLTTVQDPAAALGFFAVLLPVIAVAGLSLAAAFDLEAREHIYDETLSFLRRQTPLLEAARSENEFAILAVETERRLLGETANWYARRAFTGIT